MRVSKMVRCAWLWLFTAFAVGAAAADDSTAARGVPARPAVLTRNYGLLTTPPAVKLSTALADEAISVQQVGWGHRRFGVGGWYGPAYGYYGYQPLYYRPYYAYPSYYGYGYRPFYAYPYYAYRPYYYTFGPSYAYSGPRVSFYVGPQYYGCYHW